MLRYIASTLGACALVGTVGLLAQEQRPPADPPKEAPPPAAETTTVTGCVQEAKTTDGGKAYVLNKAEGGKASMYVLMGDQESEVASHVNHKVQVSGPVQEPGPAQSSDTKVLRPPIMQVQAVKMVAETCK